MHVLDRFSVNHQESSTVYTAIGVCHTGYADCLLAGSGWNILIPHLIGLIIRICHDAQSSECQIDWLNKHRNKKQSNLRHGAKSFGS